VTRQLEPLPLLNLDSLTQYSWTLASSQQMVALSSTSSPQLPQSSTLTRKVPHKKKTGTTAWSLASSTSLLPTQDLISHSLFTNAPSSPTNHNVFMKKLSSTSVVTYTSLAIMVSFFDPKLTTPSMPTLMQTLQDDGIKLIPICTTMPYHTQAM